MCSWRGQAGEPLHLCLVSVEEWLVFNNGDWRILFKIYAEQGSTALEGRTLASVAGCGRTRYSSRNGHFSLGELLCCVTMTLRTCALACLRIWMVPYSTICLYPTLVSLFLLSRCISFSVTPRSGIMKFPRREYHLLVRVFSMNLSRLITLDNETPHRDSFDSEKSARKCVHLGRCCENGRV
jgi:hypothetical protein